MTSIELIDVSRHYPGGPALDGVSFRAEPGQITVLIGPSGCGKTTTLRLIAGLDRPSSGRVLLGGIDPASLAPQKRGVALVTQKPVLFPHLNVAANLRFGPGRSEDAVQQAIDLLALSPPLLDRLPGELSGGQQQRVALGRALARRPAVLLLDEPFAHLDGPSRWEIRQQLPLLAGRLQTTMIHVTHDQEEALALADRLIVLDRGRIQQLDSPATIHAHPANRFVATFLGWPPINLLEGRLQTVDTRLVFVAGRLTLPVPESRSWQSFVDHPLVLGIRPEQVRWNEGELSATVRRIEGAGAMRRAQVDLSGWSVCVWPAGDWVPGGQVRVNLPLERAHLFDGVTGLALAHADPSD